jgi:hypothetical protein
MGLDWDWISGLASDLVQEADAACNLHDVGTIYSLHRVQKG